MENGELLKDLGTSFNFMEPQLPHLKRGIIIIATGPWRMSEKEWENGCET